MPKDGVNDPQGEAIAGGLHDLGYSSVSRVRSGKRFTIELTACSESEARSSAESMADRLLANPVIEIFWIEEVAPKRQSNANAS
ncbi:phosphoribosylformylglycinamidine synthase subunit PurS [soil metagenome]